MGGWVAGGTSEFAVEVPGGFAWLAEQYRQHEFAAAASDTLFRGNVEERRQERATINWIMSRVQRSDEWCRRVAFSAMLALVAPGCGASPTGSGANDGLIRGAPEDADLWLVPPNICETPVVDHNFKESFEVVSSVMTSSTSLRGKTWSCDVKIRAKTAVKRRRIRERLYNDQAKVIHEDRWHATAAEGELFKHEVMSFTGKDRIVKFEMVVER